MVAGLGADARLIRGRMSLKERFFVDGRQVFRRDADAEGDSNDVWNPPIEESINVADVVLIADYGKGMCTKKILRATIDRAQRLGKPCIVDPHGNDWSKYEGATCIKCNIHEHEKATPNLEALSKWQPDHLVVTHGSTGLYYWGDSPVCAAARPRKIADVTGAGDMVLACLGLCIAGGLSWEDACQIANAAAGRKCEKHGAVPIPRYEVVRDLLHGIKIIPAELLPAVAQNPVLANGCFDLAGAHHVYLLREARKLGDVLIVAVNDDASVRQLKGPARPVRPLQQRMDMIAGMECVDYVVSFGSEKELEQIIRSVKPIICKGEDFADRPITGAEYARGVKLVPLMTGESTTATIARLIA